MCVFNWKRRQGANPNCEGEEVVGYFHPDILHTYLQIYILELTCLTCKFHGTRMSRNIDHGRGYSPTHSMS